MTTNSSDSGAPNIEESWKIALEDEFKAAYYKNLVAFVKKEYNSRTIFPAGKKHFCSF